MNTHLAILEGILEELAPRYPRFQFTLYHENTVCPYIDIKRKSGNITGNSFFIVTEQDHLRFGGNTAIIEYADPNFVDKVIEIFATANLYL